MAVLNNNRSHPSVHSEGVRDESVYGTKKFWKFLNSGINSVNKKKGLKKFMDQHKRNQKIVSLRNQGMTFKQIGDKFKISRQRAHQIFLRWNFNWSYTPIPTPNNEKDD
jgi:DNA-directed RNA polymerase specialized sigma subunit